MANAQVSKTDQLPESTKTNVGAPNVDANQDSLWQINSGSAGLAYHSLLEAMALYLQIVEKQNKQKELMVETQGAAAKGQASATVSAGNAQMLGLVISGGLTFVGGVASMGVNAGIADSEKADYKLATEKATTAQGNLDSLKAFNEKVDQGNHSLGSATPGTASETEVIKQLKDGNISADTKSGITSENKAALMEKLKNDPNKQNEFTDIKQALDKKYDQNLEILSSNTRRQELISTRRQSKAQLVNSLAQGGSSLAQGFAKTSESGYTAASQLAQTTSSMSGQAVQGSDANAQKALDEALQINQIRKEMAATGSRG